MTSDPSDEGLDFDVERMLRTFEGPDHPVPRSPSLHARRPAVLALAAAVVVAAVAIGTAIFARNDHVRPAAVETGQACRALVVDGRAYGARQVGPGTVSVGATAGRGTVRCGDVRLPVTVARIVGVDPNSAVVRLGTADRVYVAAGLCPGRDGDKLLACLRRAGQTP